MTTKTCKECSKETQSWINIDGEPRCLDCFKASTKKAIAGGYNPQKELAKASSNLKKMGKK